MLRLIRRMFGKTVDLEKNYDQQAALKAARDAEHTRQDAVDQTGEIAVLSDRLRTLRETNHFAELIRAALLDGERPRP